MNNVRQTPLFYRHSRNIWIPPIWLRPLLQPLIVIVGGFLVGIIMQLWKGQPPQWMLTASTETAAEGAAGGTAASLSNYTGRLFGGSAVLLLLYVTRLRNPLYVSMIGLSEAKLQLAESQASAQWNALWDSRSANDSMKTRLTAMENYLGEAMSAAPADKMDEIQMKVDKIREKGYSNAIKIALERAEFWAESGEIIKFEQMAAQTQTYVAEGGTLDQKEYERVRAKAYGTRCGKLLADAQTHSNKGDVSQCQKAITEIKDIQHKLNGSFVEASKLEDVLHRAHQHHVSHMLSEARKVRETGSRQKAKLIVEQARQYAVLHNVTFDEPAAKQIV
eukprot:CAMPEP_0197042556 /NCGR_PEP_ID=MMETSP1384-20130603/18903_1 /TAXON_ID=29189 /ORGANISM="Ammonia sp." /LENGTH=333 /DNA_ID=CAMNT_0042473685 /DNA_START=162 /DNA_END=1163 /DNA_ORIENTATION=+